MKTTRWIKVAPNTRTQSKRVSKAAKIRRMIYNGAKDMAEIARRLKTPYSWVYRVVYADVKLVKRMTA